MQRFSTKSGHKGIHKGEKKARKRSQVWKKNAQGSIASLGLGLCLCLRLRIRIRVRVRVATRARVRSLTILQHFRPLEQSKAVCQRRSSGQIQAEASLDTTETQTLIKIKCVTLSHSNPDYQSCRSRARRELRFWPKPQKILFCFKNMVFWWNQGD